LPQYMVWSRGNPARRLRYTGHPFTLFRVNGGSTIYCSDQNGLHQNSL
jgi:hypothetical protein